MAKHSFNTLIRRLSQAGFKKQFVNVALLPDWWETSYSQDPEVLPEIEIRVARFLGIPLSAVKDADQPLRLPSYDGARLRRVRNDVDHERLGPSIHAAMQIGAAVIRNLKYTGDANEIPTDPLEWCRRLTVPDNTSIQLQVVLTDLWKRNIPVVPLYTLPSPSFQGMSCIIDDHPVIFLGYKYDEPGHLAFVIAHEVGHIAARDCLTGVPVLHEADGVRDDSIMERNADFFAQKLLMGDNAPCLPDQPMEAKALAQEAFDKEEATGADASALIYHWAAQTLDYAKASLAVKALYRANGGQNQLHQYLEEYVDLNSTAETDRALLRCLHGEP